jgi:hypothetical protein
MLQLRLRATLFGLVLTQSDVRSPYGRELTQLGMHPVSGAEEALVANEATGREGVAVAYVMAQGDGNGNGLLDCRVECEDVQVGASPNTIVLYG